MKQIKLWIFIGITFVTIFIGSGFAQASPNLSDGEITSVALVANQINIQYSKIAKEKSTNEDILKLAEIIITDHLDQISQIALLNKDLKIIPKGNAISQNLLVDAAQTRRKLDSISGNAFDRQYLDGTILSHQSVISILEDLLIPRTKAYQLKEFIQNMVLGLKAHLEHAKKLQKDLPKQ
jgi:putative membrane protein